MNATCDWETESNQFCCCSKHSEIFKKGVLIKPEGKFSIGTEVVIVDVGKRAFWVEVGPWTEAGVPTDVIVVLRDSIEIK